MTLPVYILTNNVGGFLFLHTLSEFIVYRLFDEGHSDQCKVIPHCSFDLPFSNNYINNLRYADDTTLMAESEEELKSLLMKVKVKSEKVGIKLNIQKIKVMASGPITSWQIDGETGNSIRLYFLGLQNRCRW